MSFARGPCFYLLPLIMFGLSYFFRGWQPLAIYAFATRSGLRFGQFVQFGVFSDTPNQGCSLWQMFQYFFIGITVIHPNNQLLVFVSLGIQRFSKKRYPVGSLTA